MGIKQLPVDYSCKWLILCNFDIFMFIDSTRWLTKSIVGSDLRRNDACVTPPLCFHQICLLVLVVFTAETDNTYIYIYILNHIRNIFVLRILISMNLHEYIDRGWQVKWLHHNHILIQPYKDYKKKFHHIVTNLSLLFPNRRRCGCNNMA